MVTVLLMAGLKKERSLKIKRVLIIWTPVVPLNGDIPSAILSLLERYPFSE